MTRSVPLIALPAALTACVLAGLLAAAAAHSAWPCAVPVDGFTAGVGVAVERALDGDLRGALEALVAIARG